MPVFYGVKACPFANAGAKIVKSFTILLDSNTII